MEYLNFDEANCQNCYKCIRTCQIKAIRIMDGQAKIVSDLCVGCGECLSICPQNAKSVKSDIDYVKELVKSDYEVVVSLAPSFPSYDNLDNPLSLVHGIKKLGFNRVEETSIGAQYVSKAYLDDYNGKKKHVITSSCPTINLLISKYYPKYEKYLSNVVSPMMVHNKLIKRNNSNCKVVFIGPCISKKEETIVCTSHDACIDAVITFDDLRNWFEEDLIDVNKLTPQKFDKESSSKTRWYPLSGGVEKASVNSQTGNRRVIKVDGMKDCVEFLDNFDDIIDYTWIEMNACKNGCINGFGNSNSPISTNKKIENVIKYINKDTCNKQNNELIDLDISYEYKSSYNVKKQNYSEQEIRKVLEKTGKFTEKDELNCATCGYNTCREKAIAVLNGMAELEMCLPHMRMVNEEMSNVITENTPNGIIVLNSHYEVLEFNPASVQMFKISKKNALGKYIADVLGDNVFLNLELEKNNTLISKVEFKKFDKVMIQSLKYIKNHNLYLGIFKDITKDEKAKADREIMSKNALDMAQEVIDKQMVVAHEIASLLGETTAETKVTLSNLKRLFDDKVGE